jgi:hypothetical protein
MFLIFLQISKESCMRIINSMLLLAVMSLSLFAQPIKASLICSPKHNKVGIWTTNERSLNQTPSFTVNTEARLCITEEAKDWYKIWYNNQIGWVLKSEVVILQKSKTFAFGDAEVLGYLDNPTPIYIIDGSDQDRTPLNLERSFKEELRKNTDRETIDRQAGN